LENINGPEQLLELKMTKKNILNILIAHFNNNKWPLGVNETKLNDRSSISKDLNRSGWYIVEIERHRSGLTASYRKGQPMAAYETYWLRYAVHQKTKKVEELPEKSDETTIDDVGSLIEEALPDMVDVSIKLIENGKYLIRDEINKYESIISTYEEAEEFALKMATELADDYLMMIEESTDISEDQLNQLKSECPEYFKVKIINEVDRLWADREVEDDEV
jgi:hypothetical protein